MQSSVACCMYASSHRVCGGRWRRPKYRLVSPHESLISKHVVPSPGRGLHAVPRSEHTSCDVNDAARARAWDPGHGTDGAAIYGELYGPVIHVDLDAYEVTPSGCTCHCHSRLFHLLADAALHASLAASNPTQIPQNLFLDVEYFYLLTSQTRSAASGESRRPS